MNSVSLEHTLPRAAFIVFSAARIPSIGFFEFMICGTCMMIFSTRLMSDEPPLGFLPGDNEEWPANDPVPTDTVSLISPPP